MLNNIWNKFITLDAWKRGAIILTIGIFGLSAALSEPSSVESEPKPSASPTLSNSAVPEQTVTPSESPTPTASPTPETPLEFRFSALRDLKDLRNDVKDARVGISEDGLGKFYWNVAEIKFNLAQLESLLPREEYADRWNTKLEILRKAVAQLEISDEDLTISKAKSQLNSILNAIPALETIARSLAN
jgi:hypothetical protein